MKLSINISTCPNDTFMFDAALHNRIDCKGYKFDLTMADIEQLNNYAENGYADITKISYAVYPSISDKYQILSSGSAIGRGNGPLLVSKRKIYADELGDVTIAIPGEKTTANALLNRCFPKATNKKVFLFSDVSTAILDDEVDCGVLIHEERFLYQQKGLHLVADLGKEWEELTGKMIPLGAIAIKRDLPEVVKRDIEKIVADSVKFGFENPMASYNFVKQNAQELDNETIKKHIDMFVSNYSVDILEDGRSSVIELFNAIGFKDYKMCFIDG